MVKIITTKWFFQIREEGIPFSQVKNEENLSSCETGTGLPLCGVLKILSVRS